MRVNDVLVLFTRGNILLFFSILFIDNATAFNDILSESQCAGEYCGRLNNETECGRCPRGYRTDGYYCQECEEDPKLFDWLYLCFMAVITMLMHSFFIYYHCRQEKHNLIMQISAFFESFFAGLFTLLVTKPKGSLYIDTCGVQQLSDWYTVFFNPKPDHVNEINCTQEAVYPLYTMVLYYYAFCVLHLMLARPIISLKLCDGDGRRCIYAALYFLPITAMIHATCAGLLYYSYPYVMLIGSILSTAILLAKKNVKNFKDLLSMKDVIVILIGHWLLHIFSLVAITRWSTPKIDGFLFILVFVPSLFYIFTVRLSDPYKFK